MKVQPQKSGFPHVLKKMKTPSTAAPIGPSGRLPAESSLATSSSPRRLTGGSWSLSTHYYAPGVRYPDGAEHIQSFEHAPFPRWVYKLPDGTEID